jgi:hypothetical protein
MEKNIKKDLVAQLDLAAKQIQNDLAANVAYTENELLQIASDYGLENDEQTLALLRFVSLGTNFASAGLKKKAQEIPMLVESIKELLVKINAETREFKKLAIFAKNLTESFRKTLAETQSNMRKIKPLMERSIVDLTVLSQVMGQEIESKPTKQPRKNAIAKLFKSKSKKSTDEEKQDHLDIELSIENISSTITELAENARNSKERSVILKERHDGILSLKESIESKIDVTGRRIGFSKILTVIFSATTGVAVSGEMLAGASVVGGAVAGAGAATAGTIALGGLSFPPLGLILLGAAAGTMCIGSLTLFIIRCWKKRQSKALEYLNELLGYMNRLSGANEAFGEYMRRVEADSTGILSNIESIKANVRTGSPRYRAANADICLSAIDSTKEVIKSINEVTRLNANELVGSKKSSGGELESVKPDLDFYEERGDSDSDDVSIKSGSIVR